MRMVEPITGVVVLADYDSIQRAFFDRHLSRTFDKRTYDEGNIRDGVVSIMHGSRHRSRRRIENTQFRIEDLRTYEHVLFPPIVERFVTAAANDGEADLFRLGSVLAVALAAKRAGFDYVLEESQDLDDLVSYVEAFAQISAIVDARDPEAVREMAKDVLQNFEEQFGMPSLRRRQRLLEAHARGEIDEGELPRDIMTSLLRYRDDPELSLTDDFSVIRAAAIYLQGGTHTSAQTLVNTVDLLLDARVRRPDYWDRVATDATFAQRCIHETLRLRPTTPRAKRRAEEATAVGDVAITEGAMVVLDFDAGNRDVKVFGADANIFDPDREIPAGVHRWGLSFGGGPHICPGRAVAGGLPQPRIGTELGDGHLFGLVATMVQAIVRHEPERHPAKPQARDDRTERFTRWDEYWVIFGDGT
jgi:cytochrome P450